MSEYLEIVKKIKPCKFHYKSDGVMCFDEKIHFGFVAQELNEVFPKEEYNIVQVGDGGYMKVNPGEIVPILVKCIQELSERIEELEKER